MKIRPSAKSPASASQVQTGPPKSIHTGCARLDEIICGKGPGRRRPLKPDECAALADIYERWASLIRASIGEVKLDARGLSAKGKSTFTFYTSREWLEELRALVECSSAPSIRWFIEFAVRERLWKLESDLGLSASEAVKKDRKTRLAMGAKRNGIMRSVYTGGHGTAFPELN